MEHRRRAHRRIPAPLHASWNRGSEHRLARTVNLSLGGCFMESHEREPPAGRLRLQLHLPHNDLLWVSGEVAHFQPDRGFGVRFLDLTEEHERTLQRALSALTARPQR
jgi:c-di-GMP-binding flagellar brake protein YcgR